jgi:hypothetical protein
VARKDRAGNESKQFKLEYMKTILSVYNDYLKPKLNAFIEKKIFAKW